MQFQLTKYQQDLREAAHSFARQHLVPHGEMWENSSVFPRDTFQAAIDAGYGAVMSPIELGGRGFGHLDAAVVYESLARGNFAFAFALLVHNNVTYGFHQLRSDTEMQLIVRELASGSKIAAFAMTEPGAGSDPLSMQSCAVPEENGYKINGVKSWVTNGLEADYINVIVKDHQRPGKLMMLLLTKGERGMEIVSSDPKMGARFVSTPTIKFENCFVPASRLLSLEGMRNALRSIDIARLFVAALAIGLTEEAISFTIRYLGGRIQFGKPLIQNQGLQWELADLISELEANRMLVYHLAGAMDEEGKVPSYRLSMAKLKATELAMKASVQCAQMLGANGMLQYYPLERMIAYAKMSQIVDGTSQVQKIVIGRHIEKEALKTKSE